MAAFIELFGIEQKDENGEFPSDTVHGKAHKKLSEFVNVEKGIFGAEMKVNIINDGPVTIILESR